jgi:predicted nucleic acid-binding protein
MSETLVIDSSVAMKWIVDEVDSDIARRLMLSDRALACPEFALAEIANGLRRKERMAILAPNAVIRAIDALPRFFAVLVSTQSLISDATKLSQAIDHSVYDCLYAIASRTLAAPLVTADAQFVAKLATTSHAPNTVLLSDWPG